jgi:hypothetical protein
VVYAAAQRFFFPAAQREPLQVYERLYANVHSFELAGSEGVVRAFCAPEKTYRKPVFLAEGLEGAEQFLRLSGLADELANRDCNLAMRYVANVAVHVFCEEMAHARVQRKICARRASVFSQNIVHRNHLRQLRVAPLAKPVRSTARVAP